MPTPVLQDWLGHASVMTTMVYTKILSVDWDVYIRRTAGEGVREQFLGSWRADAPPGSEPATDEGGTPGAPDP